MHGFKESGTQSFPKIEKILLDKTAGLLYDNQRSVLCVVLV